MMQNLEVVLVHGLWHQPVHFDRLADDLRGQGVLVHVPRLHRGSLAADTAAVQETVDGCRTAPVVVGHSYGGSVITGLERVGHLLYVAAFVPASAERMARRCTSTVSLSSSHSPFISRSRQLADLIVKT